MFSLPVLIQKSVFRTLFYQFKGLKVLYYFYFWQRWCLWDDLNDVYSDFWNITRRPIKWEDVLITRINSKISISVFILSIQEFKVSYPFYYYQRWSLRDDLRDVQLDFWNKTPTPIKWDDVLITRINSKIFILGSFLSI